jgi:16S rRNA (cytosine967-C5)-methyltransferase
LLSPARRLSFEILCQVEIFGVFSDKAINSAAMNGMEARDRHLITEIVFGTLRWQSWLDYILAGASSRPWKDVDPQVRILLRMSLYQMWRLTRIPNRALVFDAVEIAKRHMHRGIDSFVNGMLRRLGRDQPWNDPEALQKCPLWIRVSLPEWLWKRWSRRWGEEPARAFALSLNEPPGIAVRVDLSGRECDGEGLQASDLVPGAYFLWAGGGKPISEAMTAGGAQDEASQLIPHLLGDISGARIWDVCAAPGGKSAILGRMAGPAGRLVATDNRLQRLKHMKRTQELRDGAGIFLVAADVGESVPFRTCFDAVLADVPCSGLGTLRRNPEIKWRFNPGRLAQLNEKQSRILNAVAQGVRAGGKLLYSTCSTEPEENEQVIDNFLRNHADFRLDIPAYPPGIDSWIDGRGLLRTFPGTRPWDGFFAALMSRYS